MNDYQISQREDELINNVLDEGINQFINVNQKNFNQSQNFQLNNLNNNNSNQINMNNNQTNFSIEPYKYHYRSCSNCSDNSNYIQEPYSFNNYRNSNTPNINHTKNEYFFSKYNNNYDKTNFSQNQIKPQFNNIEELKRLDDNIDFLNNLRNMTLYSQKKQSIYNNNNSERLTENEINKLTKNIIKMQENISNIPLNSKINNQKIKKKDSNPLFKKSKTLTEDKIKKNITEKKYANANIEDLKKMNELYSPENFEKNNFEKKHSKKLSQNEIWKEKYNIAKSEFDDLYKIFIEEKNKNIKTQKSIQKIKIKEKKLPNLQELNNKLYDVRTNLEDKLKQSENIRIKQNDLILKLQNEIEQLRKIIRMKTPL